MTAISGWPSQVFVLHFRHFFWDQYFLNYVQNLKCVIVRRNGLDDPEVGHFRNALRTACSRCVVKNSFGS
jgi:hypothetical protein